MAGSAMTFTVRSNPNRTMSIRKIIAAWTSDSITGAVSGTSLTVEGKVIGLVTIPGGGAAAPDDNYDVVITDADDHDVLLGAGLNRDTANTEYVASASLSGVASSVLTFAVTNAGASNTGTIVLWVDGTVG